MTKENMNPFLGKRCIQTEDDWGCGTFFTWTKKDIKIIKHSYRSWLGFGKKMVHWDEEYLECPNCGCKQPVGRCYGYR